MMKRLTGLVAMAAVFAATLPAIGQQAPAPGTIPRIDTIRKAGVLRVAVLANAPWLLENTTLSTFVAITCAAPFRAERGNLTAPLESLLALSCHGTRGGSSRDGSSRGSRP